MPTVIASLSDRAAAHRERRSLEQELSGLTRAQRLDLEALLDGRDEDDGTRVLRQVLRRAAA